MSEQLKPCPFCGSYAEYTESVDEDGDHWWHIECHGCYAKSDGFTREDAAEAWNRRISEVITCRECRHKYKGHCTRGPMATEIVSNDFGCIEGQRWEED